MNQQPVLQLHDIHLPEAAGWWPPAIGWWVLASISLALLIWIAVIIWKWLKFQSWRKKLINEFHAKVSTLTADTDDLDIHETANRAQVIAITEALRQSALTLFPENTVANLTGNDWLDFLEKNSVNTPFKQSPGNLLIKAPYSDSVECDDNSVKQLKQMATAWVKHNANRLHYQQLKKTGAK